MSPDRNRALALVVIVCFLTVAGGFGVYKFLRAPASAAKASVAAVKPFTRAFPQWMPMTFTVAPEAAPAQPARPTVAATGTGQAPDRQLLPSGKLNPIDSILRPVKAPEPLPGALLPDHLIVAFYGNPKSQRMGILGQIPPDEMLPRLEQTAFEWAKADRGRKVVPALHVVVTVAQEKPGRDGKYRMRHSDEMVEEVLGWAQQRRWIVFLDVQIGQSNVAGELPHLVKYLKRPDVHLALDPEFAMKPGVIPGDRVGSLDAADVNHAVQLLGGLVDQHDLPPKLLVVHRFSRGMLTNYAKIKLDPRVQVVIDMDGFGTPVIKQDAYQSFIAAEPVQFTGFKLFYKKDRPLMTPHQVLGLWPPPVYVQYQ